MGFKGRLFLVSSAVTLALAYYVVPVFPDTANKPISKAFFGLKFQFVGLVSNIGHHLGLASHVNITRAFFETNALLDDDGNGNVVDSATTIGGVKVLIFQPKTKVSSQRPGIVYYHGGGWMLITPEAFAGVTREIAEQTQSVVVSVDYRRSPEHLFPAAFEDCLIVTKSFLRNAEKYGVDPNKIAVMGDSAGGNLAMAVTLAIAKEKDPSLPNIKLQALIYPALQAFDFYLPSYVKHADGPGFLRKQGMIRYWLYYAFGNDSLQGAFASNIHVSDSLRQSKYAAYVNADILPKELRESVNGQRTYSKGNKILSDEIESIILDPRYAPLMSSDEDLALLPSTYIMNPEFDVLRDDGFLAAARLRKVGVPVEHIYLPGEEHGLISMLSMYDSAKEEIKRFATFFNKALS